MNRWILTWTGVACVLVGAMARADSVEMATMKMTDVRITGITTDVLQFETAARPTSRELKLIVKIQVEGEAALNAAENAFVAKKWDEAVSGYQKAIDGLSPQAKEKAWIRDWASRRRAEAARFTTRFDQAVAAFIDLAKKSPDQATGFKLDMPKAGSRYLDDSAKMLETALADGNLNLKSTDQLLRVLAEVYTVSNKPDKAAEIARKRAAVQAELNPNSPEAQTVKVGLALSEARQSLAGKQYDKAIKMITDVAAGVIDPQQTTEAIFMLAEAQAGKVGEATDVDAWKEVAVAYMRVVANSPATAPEVGKSLLKAAAIHETRLNERQTAKQLYQRLAEDYRERDKDLAAAAEKELARMEKEPAKK